MPSPPTPPLPPSPPPAPTDYLVGMMMTAAEEGKVGDAAKHAYDLGSQLNGISAADPGGKVERGLMRDEAIYYMQSAFNNRTIAFVGVYQTAAAAIALANLVTFPEEVSADALHAAAGLLADRTDRRRCVRLWIKPGCRVVGVGGGRPPHGRQLVRAGRAHRGGLHAAAAVPAGATKPDYTAATATQPVATLAVGTERFG